MFIKCGVRAKFLKISLFGFGFLIKKRNPIQKAVKNKIKTLKWDRLLLLHQKKHV